MRELLGTGIAAALLLPALTTLLGFSRYWPPALLGHFRRHYAVVSTMVGLLVLLPSFSWMAKLALAALAITSALFNVRVMRRRVPGRPRPTGDGVVLCVTFANLLDSTLDHDPLLDWLKAGKVDVLMASEVTPHAVAAPRALEPSLPHGHGSRWGHIAILSRLPIVRWQKHNRRRFARLAGGEIATPAGPVQFVVVHLPVPMHGRRWRLYNWIVAAIVEFLRSLKGSVVLAGDFNATPWSPALQSLVAQGLAFGPGARRPTFPTFLPLWLGLPLDHVLAGGGCTMIDRHHGPRTHSDHLPIVADIHCARRVAALDPQDRGGGNPSSRPAPVSASRILNADEEGPSSNHSA